MHQSEKRMRGECDWSEGTVCKVETSKVVREEIGRQLQSVGCGCRDTHVIQYANAFTLETDHSN